MIKFKFIFLMSMMFCIQTSWASPKSTRFIKIPAGSNHLSFAKAPNIEWSEFCYNQKLGCARFQVKGAQKPNFGFIKVVTDKLEKQNFKKYCSEVFDVSKSMDASLGNFTNDAQAALPHCSWMGSKDMTHLFWKDGITLIVTTSDKYDVQKMIREAKLNEKN
ncbi:hypothetical protein SHI21_08535 [Bacteriovorax sp. PP10]|uniref:Uncharacterized protein n=1 Tax=Bacteriovorax antarcticus TaxID=3088717 RepID=A0ABU5VT63_9BACT|nr:hypothetical protein [Bacteriovorax sp. PP10]MEA9356246.1 hypothetical protein [Bacteriovorax sp. PP10]